MIRGPPRERNTAQGARRRPQPWGEPFGIRRYAPDDWGAYTRHLAPDEHNPGKWNTQQIECTPWTLRTRLKRLTRKTICVSRSPHMHDLVIGLLVNRYECRLPIGNCIAQIGNMTLCRSGPGRARTSCGAPARGVPGGGTRTKRAKFQDKVSSSTRVKAYGSTVHAVFQILADRLPCQRSWFLR